MLIPNCDSPNSYLMVRHAELQPVTLSHWVDAHKTLTAHKLACSCFVTLLWSSVEQASSKASLRPSQPPPHTTNPTTPKGDPVPANNTQLIQPTQQQQHTTHPHRHNKTHSRTTPFPPNPQTHHDLLRP